MFAPVHDKYWLIFLKPASTGSKITPIIYFSPFSIAHHRLVSVEDDTSVITFIEYQVLIGNRKWIKEKNFIDIPHEIDEKMKKQEELGHTALLVAIDGKKLLLFLH